MGFPNVPKGLPADLPGATSATRYVGGTASGAPITGTFQVGDFVVDETGFVMICTVAGSPGTWVSSGAASPLTLSPVPATAIPSFYNLTAIGGANGPSLGVGTAFPTLDTSGGAGNGNAAFGGGWHTGVPPAGQNGNLGALTTGATNTAIGMGDLLVLTTGNRNVALGGDIMTSLTTGSDNLGLGCQTLQNLVDGSSNIAIGTHASFANVHGARSIAIGGSALVAYLGDQCVAIGSNALSSLVGASGVSSADIGIGFDAGLNLIGGFNIAIGEGALQGSVAAATNVTNSVAIGWQAAKGVSTGQSTTALGYSALIAVTTGSSNVALGANAGLGTTTGANNTFVGTNAGRTMVAGQGNTHVGFGAGFTTSVDKNFMTLIGYQTIGEGNGCVAIGVDHTGAGATATTADYFVLGTANHKYFMPGLPTADPHVVGQLWANSGVVTVSAG